MLKTPARRGVERVLHRIVSIVALIWAAVVAALLVALVFATTAGWQVSAVRSASMAPAVPRDSLAITAEVDPADIVLGDIVTFRADSGAVVMHRVVEILDVNGVLRFRTQGDLNDDPDPGLTREDAIERRMRWSVSNLGAVTASLRPPGGLIWLAVLPGLLLTIAQRPWNRGSDVEKTTGSEAG
jgi:signal peptidase I